MVRYPLALAALVAAPGVGLRAQARSMAQDSTLDNLQHPPGTVTVADGTLGRVRKVGHGARTLVLIPGIGFGDTIWTEFMQRHAARYTMFAVTLPGFGGTAPLAMPPSGVRYVEAPWIRSAVRAIIAELDRAGVPRATIVAHWALASQVALLLALEHPDRVEGVVLVAGVLKAHFTQPSMAAITPERRAEYAELMAHRWFKQVTRTTWDDNNFMPYDYAIHPLRAQRLWRWAAEPTLPVWVRYLVEFNALDLGPRLRELRPPVVAIQPGFDDGDFFVDGSNDYMRAMVRDSWKGAATDGIAFVSVPASRLFVMDDAPGALDQVLIRFLDRPVAGPR